MIETGIHKMSFEEYAQIQAVNCSRLVAYDKSPAHALIKKGDTPGMRLGRATHSAIWEPKLYGTQWATMPEGMIRRGKAWDKWQEEHQGAEILSSEEEKAIKGITNSLTSGYYETARNLIEMCGDSTEMVLIWKHRKYDCLCKARIDGYASDILTIVDLKSTGNAEPGPWIKTALNYGGLPHWQPSWYLQGAQEVLSPDCKTFLWILVETKEPFGISVVQAAPAPPGESDMVYLARLQMDLKLEEYLESDRTGKFPGYPDKIVTVNLPQYYVNTAL